MKKLSMAAALAAALLAGPAAAQAYLGGGIGTARTDGSQASWKLYGGYQFNPTWGLEAGYTDLGHHRGADTESLSLAGTGTRALGDRWSLFGKLGAASNRTDLPGASSHTDLLLGVGVGYSMSKNLGLRLEYEDYGKPSNGAGNDSRSNNLGLGLKYGF